ncbi:hypothetical protein BIW11_12014 [Tropilaelaps mercedesae]|uniref:Uncharacterized protein n=1 Tax=Tropilaelaps mercedesae TaxID=418985 RepID=A0A1V9X943_9ACAR|nr:hypothetical protein BIW11_12014 [Tropilaelaps mercedesae]
MSDNECGRGSKLCQYLVFNMNDDCALRLGEVIRIELNATCRLFAGCIELNEFVQCDRHCRLLSVAIWMVQRALVK